MVMYMQPRNRSHPPGFCFSVIEEIDGIMLVTGSLLNSEVSGLDIDVMKY